MPITFLTYLSRYLWAVRPPPQNSAEAKNLSGALLPVKARLMRASTQWWMNKASPLSKVSLYSVSKTLQNKKIGIDNSISIPIFYNYFPSIKSFAIFLNS